MLNMPGRALLVGTLAVCTECTHSISLHCTYSVTQKRPASFPEILWRCALFENRYFLL